MVKSKKKSKNTTNEEKFSYVESDANVANKNCNSNKINESR